MSFFSDLLCLSSGRVVCLDSVDGSIDIVRELLRFYNKKESYAGLLMWYSTVCAFKDGKIKSDTEILHQKGEVLRLAIANEGKCIGLLGFNYKEYKVYEISYFITSEVRGKSNISNILDLVRDLADKHKIELIARTSDDNFKSRHLIEEHLKLSFKYKDKNNYNLFRRT